MKKRETSGATERGAVLLLLYLFVLTLCGAAAVGLTVYRRVTERTEQNFTARTALSYLANQTRRADRVVIAELDGVSVLRLTADVNGTPYDTYLYCLDGSLRELFCEQGLALPAEAGVEVLALDRLSVQQSNEVLVLTAEKDGTVARTAVYPACAGVAR